MARDIQANFSYFRRKRREAGMTQSELAERSGTSQSAISMFEAGRPDALADDKLRAVAEILGIDLDASDALDAQSLRDVFESKYCPTSDCPCNVPYLVSGQVCILVTPVSAPVGDKTRCRLCAEVMESRCPNPDCRAPVARGAFCVHCGQAYVPFVPRPGQEPQAVVRHAREQIRALTQLAHNTNILARGEALPCPPQQDQGEPSNVI